VELLEPNTIVTLAATAQKHSERWTCLKRAHSVSALYESLLMIQPWVLAWRGATVADEPGAESSKVISLNTRGGGFCPARTGEGEEKHGKAKRHHG
jgi:hypothetical protein